MFRPSSSYNSVPFFCKPSSRFVMYTIPCYSGSSISNVDPLSSLSQLNSSIEIFSQLLVSGVGPTCSSPCFCFSASATVSSLPSLVPREALLLKIACGLPTHHCIFSFFLFGCRFALLCLGFDCHFVRSVVFRFVLTFLLCAFFSLRKHIVITLTNTAKVDHLYPIHLIVVFVIICTMHLCIFQFSDSFHPHVPEVTHD